MSHFQTVDDRGDFLDRCARCSQCKFVASPKSRRHASSCPSMDFGQFHSYSGGGQVIMAAALQRGVADCSAEMLQAMSSCTMCGHCDIVCKINFGEIVEPLDSLYALRAKVAADGHSPEAHRRLVDNLRQHGNADGQPRAQRGRWAEGLAVFADGSRPEVLLHVGSTLACDATRWPALRGVVQALGRAGVSMAHLGREEGSSGSLAFDLGHVQVAEALARDMVAQALASGARTLVTFSAPALAAFRGVYPRFGLSFSGLRVLHYSEYVQELVAADRLSLASFAAAGKAVAYHDPCRLGRLSEPWTPHDPTLDKHMNGILVSKAPEALRFGNGGVYDAPRALLRAMGLEVVELERHRASSYCCGGAGGVKETVPEAAALAARNRLAELDDTACETLVSGCAGCTRHLGQHAAGRTQVLDLLGLLSEALQPVAALTN